MLAGDVEAGQAGDQQAVPADRVELWRGQAVIIRHCDSWAACEKSITGGIIVFLTSATIIDPLRAWMPPILIP